MIMSPDCLRGNIVAYSCLNDVHIVNQSLREERNVKAVNNDVRTFLYPLDLTFRFKRKMDSYCQSFSAGGLYNFLYGRFKYRMIIFFRMAKAYGKIMRANKNGIEAWHR